MEKLKVTPIKMALGIDGNNILFMKENEEGLFIGTKDNYKKLGEYCGDLFKLTDSEDTKIFYILSDILKLANDIKNPKTESKTTDIYYAIQKIMEEE